MVGRPLRKEAVAAPVGRRHLRRMMKTDRPSLAMKEALCRAVEEEVAAVHRRLHQQLQPRRLDAPVMPHLLGGSHLLTVAPAKVRRGRRRHLHLLVAHRYPKNVPKAALLPKRPLPKQGEEEAVAAPSARPAARQRAKTILDPASLQRGAPHRRRRCKKAAKQPAVVVVGVELQPQAAGTVVGRTATGSATASACGRASV